MATEDTVDPALQAAPTQNTTPTPALPLPTPTECEIQLQQQQQQCMEIILLAKNGARLLPLGAT
jgi:hypothetical protein